MGLIVFYPLSSTIIWSFYQMSRIGNITGFAGFSNYADLFANPNFLPVIRRTLIWIAFSAGSTTILGVWLASVLNTRFFGSQVVRGIVIIPWAISVSITAIIWKWMFQGEFGFVNHIFDALRITTPESHIQWLASANTSFPAMIVVSIWASLPFTTMILLAGMQGIEKELYECAAIDGASSLMQFQNITLPLILPSIMIASLLNIIWVFNSFAIIWPLTRGGPAYASDTIVSFIYKLAFVQGDIGQTAATSVLAFLALLIFSIIYVLFVFRGRI